MLRPSPPRADGSPSLYAPRSPGRARPRGPASAIGLALVLLAVLFVPAGASAVPAPRPQAQTQLTTPWTHEVSAANALPEYPRPQLAAPLAEPQRPLAVRRRPTRASRRRSGRTCRSGSSCRSRSSPPCPGSDAHDDRLWYRRTFTVPAAWTAERAAAALRRRRLGGDRLRQRQTGRDAQRRLRPFTARRHRRAEGRRAAGARSSASTTPPTTAASRAASRASPARHLLHAATGIWQTVWLEPVAAAHIDRLELTPDVDAPGAHG